MSTIHRINLMNLVERSFGNMDVNDLLLIYQVSLNETHYRLYGMLDFAVLKYLINIYSKMKNKLKYTGTTNRRNF